MRQQLPAWRDDPDRPDEESENKLNPHLCKFLDSRARSNFPMVRFNHEEPQAARRSVDLSASPAEATVIGARPYTIYEPVIVLECKRLPPPSKGREREYVTGGKRAVKGGIQRFKLGLHGAGLDRVGMIGYVQERSACDWHSDINGWILELASDTGADACVWKTSEILGPLDECTSRGLASCQSLHSRSDGESSEEIAIHHLWIVMNIGRA